MRIVCPQCGFSKEMDIAELPAKARTVICNMCLEKYSLSQEGVETLKRETATMRIPWEEDTGYFPRGLWSTIFRCLFLPKRFFSSMPTSGGYGRPIIFAIILGTIGISMTLIWTIVFNQQLIHPRLYGSFLLILAQEVILVTAPLWIILWLYCGAIIIHLLLMLFGGAQRGFEATFRVIAYSMGTQIFSLAPFFGLLIAWIYSMFLLILGLSKAHQTDTWRVIVAVLVIFPVGVAFVAILLGIMTVIVMQAL
jgi:hypothetical protein